MSSIFFLLRNILNAGRFIPPKHTQKTQLCSRLLFTYEKIQQLKNITKIQNVSSCSPWSRFAVYTCIQLPIVEDHILLHRRILNIVIPVLPELPSPSHPLGTRPSCHRFPFSTVYANRCVTQTYICTINSIISFCKVRLRCPWNTFRAYTCLLLCSYRSVKIVS